MDESKLKQIDFSQDDCEEKNCRSFSYKMFVK